MPCQWGKSLNVLTEYKPQRCLEGDAVPWRWACDRSGRQFLRLRALGTAAPSVHGRNRHRVADAAEGWDLGGPRPAWYGTSHVMTRQAVVLSGGRWRPGLNCGGGVDSLCRVCRVRTKAIVRREGA